MSEQLLKPNMRSNGRLAPCKPAFCAPVNPFEPTDTLLNTSLPALARGRTGLTNRFRAGP
jgi:hypothetical protein